MLARKFICNQRGQLFKHKADIADERIYRGLSVAAGNQSCAEQQIRYAYCEQCFLKSLSVGNCQSKGEREYYRKACKNLRRLRASLRVRAQYPHTARHRCHYYSCRQHKRQNRHPYFFAVDFLEILFHHCGYTSVVAHIGQRFLDALIFAVADLGIKIDVVGYMIPQLLADKLLPPFRELFGNHRIEVAFYSFVHFIYLRPPRVLTRSLSPFRLRSNMSASPRSIC